MTFNIRHFSKRFRLLLFLLAALILFLLMLIGPMVFSTLYDSARNYYYASAIEHVTDFVESLRCHCNKDKQTKATLKKYFVANNSDPKLDEHDLEMMTGQLGSSCYQIRGKGVDRATSDVVIIYFMVQDPMSYGLNNTIYFRLQKIGESYALKKVSYTGLLIEK